MVYGTPEQYRRFFEYEKDSHAKVLAALNAVPSEKCESDGFKKAVTLMAHLVEARRLWLYRFGALEDPPKDFFPAGVSLAELQRRLIVIEEKWHAYLGRLDEKEMMRVFEYKSLDSGRFRNTVEDILAQLFGHSLYHRGSIATLLRSIGAEPAVTDFVFWTREPVR